MIISEEEKNRIRRLHKNFSVIKEQTGGIPCPDPECASCLPCATKALQGYNPGIMGFGAHDFDYTNIGNELMAEIMAIYATGITDPVTLATKLTSLWIKYSTKAPLLAADGFFIVQNLYNNICNEVVDGVETETSLDMNAFGVCLPEDIFENLPEMPDIDIPGL